MTTKTSYNRILSITTKLNMLLLPYKVSLVIVAVWLDCFWKGCCPFWLIFFSKKNFFCVSKITFILWKLFFMVNFWINLICILQLCNSIGMTFANYMTIKTCIIKVKYINSRKVCIMLGKNTLILVYIWRQVIRMWRKHFLHWIG